MLVLKVGITLFVLGYPPMMVGKIWGDPSPFRMNGADYVGIVGFYMVLIGSICGILGILVVVWGM